jgi:Uma2 family endonuclease
MHPQPSRPSTICQPKLSDVTRTVVLGDPPAPLAAWLAQRRALGQDLFDEVWDGEYHVVPAAHRRHGDLDDQLAALLRPAARARGLWPSGPANIGGPGNYRVPDRAYFAQRNLATYESMAELVVEIVSTDDESYAKFGFYYDRGVTELLIVDPERTAVEWYRRGETSFERATGSVLLGMSEAELAAAVDWPPA